MIEIGKTYRLKKIKGLNTNSEEEYKILAIYPSENKELGDIAVYDNHGQRYVAPVNAFIDPENPEEYSPWEITKVESVYEKELMEECGGCAAAASCSGGMGSLGTAPTPALVSSFANGGPTRVNGVPVAGKSTKKKKKKNKKNEATFSGIIVEQEEIDNFNIEDVKKYFQQNIQQQEIYNYYLQDKIKIVGKTWTETQSHIGKVPFFLLFKQLDYILATAKSDNKLISNTKVRKDNITGWYYLFNTALFGDCIIQIKLDVAQTNMDKKVYFLRTPKEETVSGTPSNVQERCHVGRNTASNNIILEDNKNVNTYGLEQGKEYDLTPYFHITLLEQKPIEENIDIIWNIEEDFHEAYERITNLLAKQLDRMNFEFANTEEIIYKKEGKYKYLLKFDNENGFLKFNISQDGNIIWEKEWELEEKEDVTPIFQEIEDVYNQYGI